MTPPPRRQGTLERADCRIHFEVAGEGPAIVFAHGLGGNHMSWFQQVAHFSRHYQCVTFAHRGFHPSTRIEGGPDPADYAADLAALIDHLGLGEVRIVAQSMGGWSAVEYALTRPRGLRALVLACTTGTIDLDSHGLSTIALTFFTMKSFTWFDCRATSLSALRTIVS